MHDHPTSDGSLKLEELTQWFIDNTIIPDRRSSKFLKIKRAISGALTRYHIHDDELGAVRTIYPVRVKDADGQTVWEWAYGPLAPAEHVAKSLRQRFNSVEARILHIESDRKYYIKTNKHGADLPLFDYDFNRLIEEKQLSDLHGGEYPDHKPEA